MKRNKMDLIEDAFAGLVAACPGLEYEEIIEALTGVAWDEEDAGELYAYFEGYA